MSRLVIRAMRAAIERDGHAEVRADQLAMLAGASALDDAGWAAIDAWLAEHGLETVSRPSAAEGPKAKAWIVGGAG